MTSYTGTRHPLSVGSGMGDCYPIVNPQFGVLTPVVQRATKRRVHA